MGLGSGLLGGLPARELERRERADELGMLTIDVAFRHLGERLFVLGFEGLPAPTCGGDGHLALKTIYVAPFFPFAASAYASWRLDVTCLKSRTSSSPTVPSSTGSSARIASIARRA